MVWLTGSSFASCSMVGWSSWLTIHLQSSLEINPYYRQPSRLPTRAQALWAFKYELTTEPPLRVPLAAQPGSSSRGAFLSNFRLRANFFFFSAAALSSLRFPSPCHTRAMACSRFAHQAGCPTRSLLHHHSGTSPVRFPCFHHRVTSACATNKVYFGHVASCSFVHRSLWLKTVAEPCSTLAC